MSTALGAAVDEWGVMAAVIASLGGVVIAAWQASNSRRAGVSGDEREARRDERSDRRDTIADRDALIQSLETRVTAVETRHASDREAWLAERRELRDRVDELEQREDDTRHLLMLHAAWDYQAIELARAGGVILPLPPPLIAPRLPRDRDREGD